MTRKNVLQKQLWLPSILLLLVGVACQGERDIRDFYFPVRALTEGQVYVYEPLAGISQHPIYWYALGVEVDTALFLTITTYDTLFNPSSLVREQLFKSGVVTQDLRIYATDSLGQAQESSAAILAGNAFPFYLPAEQAAASAYVYRVRYTAPDREELVYTLTYNRQFEKDTTIELEGEKHPAIRFHIAGETDIHDPLNGSLTPSFEGYEIYAKNLGLVESYRNFGSFVLHNRLRQRLTMPAFEKLSRAGR